MPWGLLLAFIFFVWCLGAVSEIAQVELEKRRRPLPDGSRRGISLLPVIPVGSLLLSGAAELIDVAVDPWGTIIVCTLHAVWAVILVVFIARDLWRLRSLATAKPGDAPDPED